MDAPVANLTEQAPVSSGPRETQPDDGDGRAAPLAATDGTEGVESFALPSLDARETLELSVPSDIDTLPDIATASFGPTPETVHGVDDRVQITNTADYPWRAHASLLITAADNSRWIGTGWFIGPHTLMTAGHVVYIKNSGVPGRDGFVKSIQVMPGRDGTKLPFGRPPVPTSARSTAGRTTVPKSTTTAPSSCPRTWAPRPDGSVSAYTTTRR
jgi:V8-like Glu-specific endopeptidase